MFSQHVLWLELSTYRSPMNITLSLRSQSFVTAQIKRDFHISSGK